MTAMMMMMIMKIIQVKILYLNNSVACHSCLKTTISRISFVFLIVIATEDTTALWWVDSLTAMSGMLQKVV
jgi:hypothetical protein